MVLVPAAEADNRNVSGSTFLSGTNS